ncbi:MAG: endonuclease V [Flavisolibacter sp.]|nr:endonuclease V [Flavisolibacter sp.]MBD0289545.1 endonuclease V [Flavisolibacter sp.]MBD0375822.1 endonuclease V [Flavisolibacter sp.]
MFKAALDVHYRNHCAKAVCFLFKEWSDTEPICTYTTDMTNVEKYEPGAFYKRELPCLLKLLKKVDLHDIEVCIIDGYVYLDDQETFGLGGYLYKVLEEKIPVIGVAKSAFYTHSGNVVELKRGKSNKPLYITAIGMGVEKAARYIQSMAGSHRIPHLLKLLDRRTKENST